MISLSVFTISSLSKASEERGNVTRGSFATSPTHQMLSSAQARVVGTSNWGQTDTQTWEESPAPPQGPGKATGLCGCAPAWDVACRDQYSPCAAVLPAQAQEGISSRAPALRQRLQQCSSTELPHRQGSVCSGLAASGHCPPGDQGTAALEFPHHAQRWFKEPLLWYQGRAPRWKGLQSSCTAGSLLEGGTGSCWLQGLCQPRSLWAWLSCTKN